MASLATLLVATVLTGAGGDGPVLLSFSSQHCGPCRSMAPIVDRLVSAGYPIQRIDVEQHPELAGRFKVTGIPCFILVAGEQEIDRVLGATTFGRLQQMFAAMPPRGPSEEAPRVRGQSPVAAPGADGPGGSGNASSTPRPTHPAATARGATPAAPASYAATGTPTTGRPTSAMTSPASQQAPASQGPAASRSTAVHRALQATVRIRVEDASGQSTGTGTIIDTHGEEALIITCGHLFRESQGRGKISVELFAPGAKGPLPGQILDFHADDRDIALLSIRPGIKLTAAPLAPAGMPVQPGAPVFSIGCDRGGSPSVRTSEVAAVDKYLGPPNVEVKGQPVDGRSGGGLFAADGRLIGICNAADPTDDEGVYAALPNVHWLLDRVGLQHIYQRTQVASAATRAPAPATAQLAATGAGPAGATVPSMPRHMPDAPPAATGDTEVICIVRSRTNPSERGELFIVPQPSAEFLAQLQQERQPLTNRVTALPANRSAVEVAAAYASRSSAEPSGPIVRGQSGER